MKLFVPFLFAVQLLFFFTPAYSQFAKPIIAKEPAWVSKQEVDYNKTSLDNNATDGYIDVSYEIQISLSDQSIYYRHSKKIISSSGVQNASEITASYDPSYEQLIFHAIRIIRNGETINKLQLSKLKIVHQEDELANYIYNGTLNAVLIVDDVRKGDILEYSYTIKGFNPIFKNKFSTEFDTRLSVPVYQLYYKLIVPGNRKINCKNLNETIQPTITSGAGQQVYEWRKNNVSPLLSQDYMPSWYDPYAQILISEYNNWKDVNDWATQIFPHNKVLSASVRKKVNEIKNASADDDSRTKAALQFVQDDIRYMGIEMGENSHKPADPSKVFDQRFGDCKEKSYLLCCMLTAMNIEANIVLINTDKKSELENLLPTPSNFNHATVRIKLDGSYYWFDPTISYQRGSIKNLFYPDYKVGLVVSDTSTSLTTIPYRDISNQNIKENFRLLSMSGGATFIVTTDFAGSEADDTRSDYNDRSSSEILIDNQKFYSRYYEDIKADSISYTDNDSTGIFTTTEYYSIPSFWTIDKDSVKTFSFSPFDIDGVVRRPKEKKRTMPFSLLFPINIKEAVTIDMPEEWHVTNSDTHLDNAGFAYNCTFYGENNRVYLIADYKNHKDYVTIDETPDYFKSLDKYDKEENYNITLGATTTTKESKSDGFLSYIFPLVIITCIIIFSLVRLKYQS